MTKYNKPRSVSEFQEVIYHEFDGMLSGSVSTVYEFRVLVLILLGLGDRFRQTKTRMIERNFDVPFVANLALREKQIQQNYRPIIAVHKWFARRPGTLFRALLLSEFHRGQLRDEFYRGHSLKNVSILDPFMGGGTTLIEANRVGCAITGFDINPMAWWIVRQEIADLDLDAYLTAANGAREALEKDVGNLYRTRCTECKSDRAHVKYFLWVKSLACRKCAKPQPRRY